MPIRTARGWPRQMDLLRRFSKWKTSIFPEQGDRSLQLVSLMNNVPGVVYRGLPTGRCRSWGGTSRISSAIPPGNSPRLENVGTRSSTPRTRTR